MRQTNKPLEFDIERLSNDIDKLFQKKLTEKKNSFNKHVEFKKEFFNKSLEKINGEVAGKVTLAIETLEEKLLAEIQKNRTIINISNQETIELEPLDHPETAKVLISLKQFKKAMLVGPAGTGKTYMIESLAKKLALPFYKYSCSRDSSVHDLLGYKQPRSEKYLETTFLKAYEKGGVFLVDEYDAMSGDMSLFFNGIADNSSFIAIPHRDDKPIAVKHKDFLLVMCGNTWGKGSIEYSGRDFQDMALMDRFRFSRHFIGYHTKLEKVWMGEDYDFVLKLREKLEALGSYLSTRNIEDISILIKNNSKRTIIDIISRDLSEADSKELFKIIQ